MIKSVEYGLITFESTHAAILAQKILCKFNVVVMPTLRAITASCGISLRVDSECLKEAENALVLGGIDEKMFAAYEIHQENGQTDFKKIEYR